METNLKQASKTRQEPSAVSLLIKQRLREAMMLLLLGMGAFLLLSLMSYHQEDPGWSHLQTLATVYNAGGKTGAWFADVSLYLFGYLSYLFPLIVFYCAWLVFQVRPQQAPFHSTLFLTRAVGFVLTLVVGCGLFSLHFHWLGTHLPLGAGGVLGDIVGRLLVAEFNALGSTLLLVVSTLTGITLATGLSWLALMDWIGKSLWRSSCGLFHLAKRLGSWLARISWQDLGFRLSWRSWRTDRIKAKVVSQSPVVTEVPVIVPPPVAIPVVPPEPKVDNSTAAVAKTKKTKRLQKAKQLSFFTEQGSAGLPAFSLLESPKASKQAHLSQQKLQEISALVEARLRDFGVTVEVVAVHPGPVITRFELSLAPGIKASKITGLAKDLARSLSVVSVRVVEIIPGKPYVGLELPNENRQVVCLQEVLVSDEYERMTSPLALALGKDIGGLPVVVDLAKMPHLLVAGTTGSGKSVGLNGMLLSILFKAQPEEVRLIMIDPKMLELAVYDDIPHLLAPVVTDMKEAANALKWCVAEMERRYQLMAALGVRNLAGYNRKVNEAIKHKNPIVDPTFEIKAGQEEEPPVLTPMPFIVVVVDEFADMIMVVGKKVEELIARIAQKARAAGIHLILATQRPSVDVITGLIKANVPTRIAYQVASRIDSRTILDQQGAEQLLGRGDMLYLPIGAGLPVRVHGAFVDDHEVHQVVDDWKKRAAPDYLEEIVQGTHGRVSGVDSALLMQDDEESNQGDPLYDEAVMIVTESRRASISMVQRRLKIGYNRAARLVEQMEAQGVVTAMQSNGSREVLAPPPVEL